MAKQRQAKPNIQSVSKTNPALAIKTIIDKGAPGNNHFIISDGKEVAVLTLAQMRHPPDRVLSKAISRSKIR